MPQFFTSPDDLAKAIHNHVGDNIRVGLPLGLGKANHIINALFKLAQAQPEITLHIYTALTLSIPKGKSTLEKRFLAPLTQRLFGSYEPLLYGKAIAQKSCPDNIKVFEFFFPAGGMLNNAPAQQNYMSLNYTHVVRQLLDIGINVVPQLVAKRESSQGLHYSLSSNPDLTLDILPALERRKAKGEAIAIAGQVNDQLPYMEGDAELSPTHFDFILDGEDIQFDLYNLPKAAVSQSHYAAAAHVAGLIKDGGTLQIGIGDFADALTHILCLRHKNNMAFQKLRAALRHDSSEDAQKKAELAPFDTGLYGASEIFVDGFIELASQGILKREVEDGKIFHGAFFLGSKTFYKTLRNMSEDERRQYQMTAVSFVNQLFGDEDLKRRQRPHARFINNAMMVTLMGAVISDQLEDGRVVSGVGGQYNFIAMAHELEDARSIIVLNAARQSSSGTQSNILWDYGHTTIPRHLRDIVVTEYGIADLRGKSDRDCIAAMLNIADSRFQPRLLGEAKAARKIEQNYKIPEPYRNNTPEHLTKTLAQPDLAPLLPDYPFGTEFTPLEQKLIKALKYLKTRQGEKLKLAQDVLTELQKGRAEPIEEECLEHMDLDRPKTLRERGLRLLMLAALRATQK